MMHLQVCATLLLCTLLHASAFTLVKPWGNIRQKDIVTRSLFDKMFEEEGPLGKGITVGKVQVALMSNDRSPTSIYGLLERKAKTDDDSPYGLARLTYDVCMSILRKADDWVAASSESVWFKEDDAGRAESRFNDLANKEFAKFEKDYIPENNEEKGGPTVVVVSMVLEIQGDATKFEGAGTSISATKDVLSSIASNCMIEEGECLNAVEIFWTPSDPNEVMSRRDMIADFPTLIDL